MTDYAASIAKEFSQKLQTSGFSPGDLKKILNQIVGENYPLPPWTTLKKGAVIQDVETATFGCGVLVVLKIDGERHVLMGQAGAHCEQEFKSKKGNENIPFPVCYTIPGGYGNLTNTRGSSQVPASNDKPESGFETMAAETEEEFQKEDKSPLISIDPEDIILLDTLTLSLGPNNKRIVMGGLYEATAQQINTITAHVSRMETDDEYKQVIAGNSANEYTKLPEVSDHVLFKLDDLADGLVKLYHSDQQSLFLKAQKHYDRLDSAIEMAASQAVLEERLRTMSLPPKP